MYWNKSGKKGYRPSGHGLTLTWDVLKFMKYNDFLQTYPGLTLTWDVLK